MRSTTPCRAQKPPSPADPRWARCQHLLFQNRTRPGPTTGARWSAPWHPSGRETLHIHPVECSVAPGRARNTPHPPVVNASDADDAPNRRSCGVGGALAGEADEVALSVGDEGHPLLQTRLTEQTGVVGEDHMRLAGDRHAIGTELLDGRPHIVDAQIDQRTGRAPFEQQPRVPEAEEDQPGRIECRYRRLPEELGVERRGPLEIFDMLGDLVKDHSSSSTGVPTASDDRSLMYTAASTSAAPTPSRRCRCSPTTSHEKMTPSTGVRNKVTATRLEGWFFSIRHSSRYAMPEPTPRKTTAPKAFGVTESPRTIPPLATSKRHAGITKNSAPTCVTAATARGSTPRPIRRTNAVYTENATTVPSSKMIGTTGDGPLCSVNTPEATNAPLKPTMRATTDR